MFTTKKYSTLFVPHENANEAAIKSLKDWHDKTDWVQETSKPRELGKHRADILRERIEALEAKLAMILADRVMVEPPPGESTFVPK